MSITASRASNVLRERRNILASQTAEPGGTEAAGPARGGFQGGCLVPLNDHDFVIDIPTKLNIPIILVANLYLGSINHTLLTVQLLKQRNLSVTGIIFNGKSNPESERIILKHSGYKTIWHIKDEAEINSDVINAYAEKIKQKLE